jgi:transcriptional regulator with XRE-family HTH domain
MKKIYFNKKKLLKIMSKDRWTPSSLSRAMGVTPPVVLNYIKGRSTPTLKRLNQISKIINVDPFKLLKRGE